MSAPPPAPLPIRSLAATLLALVFLSVPAWPAPEEAPPPSDEEIRALLTEAQLLLRAVEKEGDPRKIAPAVELLGKAEAMDPQDPEVLLWRGIAAVMGGDEAGARAAVARLRAKGPYGDREPGLHFVNALVLLRFEKKADLALQEVRLARRLARPGPRPRPPAEMLDRTEWSALTAHAERLLRERQADAAVNAFREAARLARRWPQQSVSARRAVAIACERASRFVEAEEEWRSLVRQYPGVADFRMGLAGVLGLQFRHADAEKEHTEALRLLEQGKVPPRDRATVQEARLRRANAIRLQGRVEEAKAEIERYVAERPDDARGHYWLGVLWFDHLEKPAEALPHLERARALAPYCDEPLRALLRIYSTALPDAEKAKALERTLEEGKAEREAAREKMAQERPNSGTLCL